MTEPTVWDKLKDPWPPSKLHWRVGNTNKKAREREANDKNAKPTKGQMLAYIDARDVMIRLDSVLGPENWQDDYVETGSGRLICRLMIRVYPPIQARLDADGNPKIVGASGGEWIVKSDGAGDTQVEGEKGALSDAFKRAAVKFGVGRYLYMLDSPWVDLDSYGRVPKGWAPTSLPKWAYPRFTGEQQ